MPTPDPTAVVDRCAATLVVGLGDRSFRTREAAERQLRGLGMFALPQLVQGLDSQNPEVVIRSSRLVDGLRPKAMPRVRELTPSLQYSSFLDLQFSPDGNRVAVCGEFGLSVWDVPTGRMVKDVKLTNYLDDAVAFTADGNGVWLGGGGGLVRRDLKTDKSDWVVRNNRTVFADLRLSPDGKFLLGATGRDLWVIDAVTGEKVRTIQMSQSIRDFKLGPDGRTAVLGCLQRTVAIADIRRGEVVREWQLPVDPPIRGFADDDTSVLSVAWSPDGKSVACGTSNGPTGGRVYLYTPDGKLIRDWWAHCWFVRDLEFARGGRFLLSVGDTLGSKVPSLVVWDPATGGACLRRACGGGLAVSEDLGLVAVYGSKFSVCLHHLPHPAWSSVPEVSP